MLDLLLMKVVSAYNTILRRSDLNVLRAIICTYHPLIRFPTTQVVGELQSDQALARHCYVTSLKGKKSREAMLIERFDAHIEGKQ